MFKKYFGKLLISVFSKYLFSEFQDGCLRYLAYTGCLNLEEKISDMIPMDLNV